jgi:large subunit ribosomal protein L4
MTTVNVQSPSGEVAGTIDLPASLFDVEVNVPLVHQVVVGQLAAARQGTHDTKSRGEVRGGGRKPYRQKGTGRARQGSTRAPQFVGGGVVHGPTPRSYAQRTPKKMKAAALRSALSDRARGGRLHVVSGFVDGDAPSTKTAASVLGNVAASRHVLVVVERTDVVGWKSLRNIDTVHVIAPDQLNTYDVLVSDDVVFTQAALNEFVEGRAGESVTVSEAKPTKKAPSQKAPAKKATAKKAAAKKAASEEAGNVAETPDAGQTKPAGEGVSDEEAIAEVAEQTSSDLKAEDVFEREADGTSTDAPADKTQADEVE